MNAPRRPAGSDCAAAGGAKIALYALLALAGAPWPAVGAENSAKAVTATPSGGNPVAEPDDYRTDAYRAPVPASISGGTVVDTVTAKRLHDDGVAFIDVLPRAPRPKGLPEDTIWRPKPRDNIPGSIWLVDTGYGDLAPATERYLLDGFAQATGGDRGQPVVVYCLRDCWMSYNAAKRAIRAGYTAVHWYPDGTDGWAEAGYALAPSEPEKRPDE